MAPRDDRLYILDVLSAIRLVHEFTAVLDRESFLTDEKTHSAVLYQLQIIGEACSHVSSTVRSMHQEIPWRQIVGMRNNLVHEYFGRSADSGKADEQSPRRPLTIDPC